MEKRIDKPGFGVVGGRIRHVDASPGELYKRSFIMNPLLYVKATKNGYFSVSCTSRGG